MTIVEERPVAEATERSMQRRVTAPATSWRFSSRLARREVRRRPGRTLLVVLLVIIPVIGMTVGSVSYRTVHEAAATRAERQTGTADLRLFPTDREDVASRLEQGVLGPGSPELPEGSSTVEYVDTWTAVSAEVEGAVVTRTLNFTDADLSDPILAATVDLTAGRIPVRSGEVLFDPQTADRLGVDVGDDIRFFRPDLELEVVGIGLDADSWGNDWMVVPGFDRTLFESDGNTFVNTLVDLPDTMTETEIETLRRDFQSARVIVLRLGFEAEILEGANDRELAWGWVTGVVSLVAVGIVIAAAFATSARRQLVTIGQLSANGAPERLVRRTMGLQGLWTGLLGAALGVAVAVMAMVAAHRFELIDRFANHRLRSLAIAPADLVVILLTATAAATIAALIPARSAARIPVLSALAGRRPVSTPPKWMGPVGIASFLVGLFLLGGAASIESDGDFPAMLAVVGSLCVLGGIVCASPLIVAAVGSVGSRAGGVVRLASRSLGRSRSRSAAVLTAIATVGALATIGATVAPVIADDGNWEPDLRNVSINYQWGLRGNAGLDGPESSGVIDPPPVVAADLPAALRAGVERVLPDATWTPIVQTQIDPPPFLAESGARLPREGADPNLRIIDSALVADSALLAELDLSDAQQQILADDGVLSVWPYLDRVGIETPAGPVVVDLASSTAAVEFEGEPDSDGQFVQVQPLLDSFGFGTEVLVSEQFVIDNEIPTEIYRYQISNPRDLSDAERDALRDLQPGYSGDDAFTDDASAPGFDAETSQDSNAWFIDWQAPQVNPSSALIQLAVVMASLLLVLGVVAIGLSLAATESRDERDVLHAVGAAPKTLRWVAAAKAWVLTTGAGIVAVPAGYITIFVVQQANNPAQASDSSAPFPFVVAVALLVIIPAIAAAATLVVSATAQKFRPTTYSDLAFD